MAQCSARESESGELTSYRAARCGCRTLLSALNRIYNPALQPFLPPPPLLTPTHAYTRFSFTRTRVSVPAALRSDWLRCQQGQAQACCAHTYRLRWASLKVIRDSGLNRDSEQPRHTPLKPKERRSGGASLSALGSFVNQPRQKLLFACKSTFSYTDLGNRFIRL